MSPSISLTREQIMALLCPPLPGDDTDHEGWNFDGGVAGILPGYPTRLRMDGGILEIATSIPTYDEDGQIIATSTTTVWIRSDGGWLCEQEHQA